MLLWCLLAVHVAWVLLRRECVCVGVGRRARPACICCCRAQLLCMHLAVWLASAQRRETIVCLEEVVAL